MKRILLMVVLLCSCQVILAGTYDCLNIEKVGSLEAGKEFELHLPDNKETVAVSSEEMGSCEGTAKLLENKILISADLGGSHCSSDGFTLLIDRSVFSDFDKGFVSVPTNDPSDVYACTKK